MSSSSSCLLWAVFGCPVCLFPLSSSDSSVSDSDSSWVVIDSLKSDSESSSSSLDSDLLSVWFGLCVGFCCAGSNFFLAISDASLMFSKCRLSANVSSVSLSISLNNF